MGFIVIRLPLIVRLRFALPGIQVATRKVEEVAKQGVDAGTAVVESVAGKTESLMQEPEPAANEGEVR